MTFLIGVLTSLAILPLILVFIFVLRNGFSGLTWNFFTGLPQPMGQSGGGVVHALMGSAILVGTASFFAIPLGVLTGLYLSEYKQAKFAKVVQFAVDLLLGIPSIIVGLFAYALLVVPFKTFSGWAGASALAIIMFAPIAKTTCEVLKLVPQSVREAGLGLGLSRWRVSVFIILRGRTSSVVTAVILSVARCLGETAPLLFTAFGNRFWPKSLSEPMASLPVEIYNYSISPFEEAHRMAWAGACFLLAITFCVNLIARLLVRNQGTQ
jgi:phosphate transport system permease protein